MALTSFRQHKIYLAAMMGYGLGSENQEEIAYYNKVKADINKDNRSRNLGIQRED